MMRSPADARQAMLSDDMLALDKPWCLSKAVRWRNPFCHTRTTEGARQRLGGGQGGGIASHLASLSALDDMAGCLRVQLQSDLLTHAVESLKPDVSADEETLLHIGAN